MNGDPFVPLNAVGLNLQAVFQMDMLPVEMRDASMAGYAQLILIGNAGPALGRAALTAAMDADHPIDTFSTQAVCRWLDSLSGGGERLVLYPGEAPVGLQRLGALAGWHHPSPFMVGIQPQWGTWFAYRVVVLANTALAPTSPLQTRSPCTSCTDRPCVSACPAGAMADGRFSLDACLAWRRASGSSCEQSCMARLACPVGAEHRYDAAQIHHAYGQSLSMIRRFEQSPD